MRTFMRHSPKRKGHQGFKLVVWYLSYLLLKSRKEITNLTHSNLLVQLLCHHSMRPLRLATLLMLSPQQSIVTPKIVTSWVRQLTMWTFLPAILSTLLSSVISWAQVQILTVDHHPRSVTKKTPTYQASSQTLRIVIKIASLDPALEANQMQIEVLVTYHKLY